jgi:TonB family protein
MSSPAQKPIAAPVAPAPDILPTLFGAGYGTYKVRRETFVISFLLHTVMIITFLTASIYMVSHKDEIKKQAVAVFTIGSGSIPLPPSPNESGGGGGGGDRDKLEAPKGTPPKFAAQQITPPAMVIRNSNPKLAVDPTVIGPPDLKLPQTGQMGDPLSKILGPPSNGTGSGGGIGSGVGGGVGSGRGGGVGPGWGGGIGGGPYRVGGGVTAPRTLYAPDPEYSEEARKAKYQGTVILWVRVGANGRVQEIHVQRSLGMGLDEKAIESVKQWKFEPGRKNGQPVPVQINVEVNFRLY